ncbi:MAG: kanamycin nucleotidyltransferase C-terminal domain-containing protein [Armatimonadota bacterium]
MLDMTHEERLEIARDLARRILDAYGDGVLAVLVTSSTARALDRAHSDLELTAVMRDGVEVEDTSYVHRGIVIEIEYPQESAILKSVREVTRHWPLRADEYRGRIVLFERNGWLRHLDHSLDERDAGDFSRGLALATTVLIECRDKLRNARLSHDDLDTRCIGLWIAENAATLVLFLNRRRMITTSWLFKQAFECPLQPPDFRRHVEILIGVVPSSADEISEAAERLTARLIELVATQGIKVASDELIV